MYAAAFGLKQEPFSIAPDPRFLFMSERHREALAHLLYGVRGGGGFVLLTGEIGAGKTTVARCFLEQIPKRCNVAYIFNPKLTTLELMQAVCDEFHVPVTARTPGAAATVKDHVDALNRFLLDTHAVGQNNLLIIDEAQNLSAEVLEQLRLLTNLETHDRKLLQIVLIGQPELRDMVARPELEQLAQRVIARYHLGALSAEDTLRYLQHRLTVAGGQRRDVFAPEALARIHALARGVPRRINLLADRSLLGAYGQGRTSVDREMVDRAAAEVFGLRAAPKRRRRLPLPAAVAAGMAAGAGLVALGFLAWPQKAERRAGDEAAGRAASAPLAAASSAAAPTSPGPAALALAAPSPAAPAASAAALAAGASAPAAPAPLPWAADAEERPALRRLAAQWQLDTEAEPDPCAAAQRRQSRCFRGRGDVALLRQLDRPGVLALRDDAGRTTYALLTALAGDAAVLKSAAGERRMPLGELGLRWGGEFTTLWRLPPGWNGRSGAPSGTLAAWMSAQFERLPGAAAIDPEMPREAALRAQVRAFQRTQGLPVDGLAGPMTLMRLNRVAGVDEPRLAAGG